MSMRSIIRGAGGYVPGDAITNDALIKQYNLDSNDEWIRERTGIASRHIAPKGMLTSDLAIKAAEQALRNANMPADQIDLIVLATTTPDNVFPATAVKVQATLGCRPGIAAFDIQAVCTGFVYALATADSYLRTGLAKRALVIGAEVMSSILDWSDRGTCILFGDGAGAVVLEAVDENKAAGRGILSSHLHADGRHADRLYADDGVFALEKGYVKMDGKEVYRHAVNNLAQVVDEAIDANHLDYSDLNWLVPHQANIRILESTAKKLGMPMDQVIVNIDRLGNTSAASVPLALAEGINSGRIKEGQLCLLNAMGGGFTWGAVLLRL